MRKMQKVSAILLTLAMILGLLAGCGGGGGNNTTSQSPAGGAASGSASSAAPAVENKGEVYKWSLGTIYTDPATSNVYNAFGESIAKFVELVSEKTNGQVEITPYYNSVLGTAPELYEQARRNEIQVFISQPMSTIDKRFGLTSIPGVFDSYDTVKKVFTDPNSEFFKLMAGVVEDTGLTMLANSTSVFRIFYNSKKVIKVPSDLKGMSVRIYEDTICNEYWKGLCSAVVIPYSEMFMSIQTGVVDGAEHTTTAGVSSLYEVCSYASDINWQWTWGAPIIVNPDALSKLPADLQDAVREAAIEASKFYDDLWVDYNVKCEAEMPDVGIDYYRLTDAERQEWVDYARSLDSKFVDLVGKDFYDKGMAIVNSYKG